MTKANPHNLTLALLCQGCSAQAVFAGFLTAREASEYARHVMGWKIFDLGTKEVFCPDCREDRVEYSTVGENDLYRRVAELIRAGEDVTCTAEEWPEVQQIIAKIRDRAYKGQSWVTLSAAQAQYERLKAFYEPGDVDS